MRYRIIPTLLLKNEGFVKSKNFKAYKHLGDPENIVRIFNELEVDELSILDISAYRNHRGINFNLISKIAAECFMPLSYGGGINNICQADQLFEIGLEKIILNSVTYDNPSLVQEISYKYGTQALVASVDVKTNWLGKSGLYDYKKSKIFNKSVVEHCVKMESLGVGEILLTKVNNDGRYVGYDWELIEKVSNSVSIPVIASGGASGQSDLDKAVEFGASAVAVGSLVVFQKRNGVLVNVPKYMVRD